MPFDSYIKLATKTELPLPLPWERPTQPPCLIQPWDHIFSHTCNVLLRLLTTPSCTRPAVIRSQQQQCHQQGRQLSTQNNPLPSI